MERMKFDRERYLRESREPDYITAGEAYNSSDFEKTHDFYRRTYKNGNTLSAVHLGCLYYMGYGVGRDYAKAAEFFEEAMRRGCPLGAAWLAECYRYGNGRPKNLKQGQAIYDSCAEALCEMAEAGDAEALYLCGHDRLYGNYTEKDEAKAYEYLSRAMEKGHIGATADMGKIYIYGLGVEEDERKGIEILERHANKRHRVIRGLLGMAYFNGLGGMDPDFGKALEHLLVAAEYGDVPSQRAAGFLLAGTDHKVPADYPEAVKWLSLAAEAGDAVAYTYLAQVYSEEDFEGQDRAKVAEYLRLAEKTMEAELAAAEEDSEEPDGFIGSDYWRMADLYYWLWEGEDSEGEDCEGEDSEEDERLLQCAFDNYCRALADDMFVAYDTGYLYFVNGLESPFFTWTPEEILKLMKEEAESEDAKGEYYRAYLIGRIYEEGLRVPQNPEEAVKWYVFARKEGGDFANWTLANYYRENGQEEEYFAVLTDMYDEEMPDVELLEKISECYEKGIGVAKDPETAGKWKAEADRVSGQLDEAAERADSAAEGWD